MCRGNDHIWVPFSGHPQRLVHSFGGWAIDVWIVESIMAWLRFVDFSMLFRGACANAVASHEVKCIERMQRRQQS